MRVLAKQKVAAFLPINAAGHIQGLLAVANRIREDHNIRCVFIMAGPPHSRTIEDHGHQLIELPDLSEPLYDYEIKPNEDLTKPMDEEAELRLIKRGKTKRAFKGAERWPQFMARHHHLLTRDPKQTHEGFAKFIDAIFDYCSANSQQLSEAIDSLSPDLIVCDSVIVEPTVLKHEQTRPWIRVWSPNPMQLMLTKLPNSVCPPKHQGTVLYTKDKRAQMKRDNPQVWQAILDEWARESAELSRHYAGPFSKLTKFYTDSGCAKQLARTTDQEKSRMDSPHVNVYMFPKAIDYDQDDDLLEYPSRWLRCDSLMRKDKGEKEVIESKHWSRVIEDKMKAGGFSSIVYFSLGSIASGEPTLMQRYIDYLSSDQSNRLYIVSKGVNGHKVELDERNMIGANYLPQTFMLQQADLAIIHGGNNSLTECLYYGKPVIILPFFADQFDNAQRIEDLALGKWLNLHKCTRGELFQALDELTSNKELSARLGEIGAEMRARDDLGKVSRILGELIEKKALSDQTAQEYGIKVD